jgi:hypothetical protein
MFMNFDSLISWLIRGNWLFIAIWIALLAGATAAGFGESAFTPVERDSRRRSKF